MTEADLNASISPYARFLDDPREYVERSMDQQRILKPVPTARQFRTVKDILARLSGAPGMMAQKGVLLADDVGLGKTTVGALLAWIFVRAGRRVRILAPNQPMVRRWKEELHAHMPLLDPANAEKLRARVGEHRERTASGQIDITTHYKFGHAGGNTRTSDLLIVDEAHRAKGEKSQFRQALHENHGNHGRIVILTATPFSLDLGELLSMLELVGAQDIETPVREYKRTLDRLYETGRDASVEDTAERLVAASMAAVNAIRPHVIRHDANALLDEQDLLGARDDRSWQMNAKASAEDIEAIVRVDRARRIACLYDDSEKRATNDPRFHVGWNYLTREIERLGQLDYDEAIDHQVVSKHLERARALVARSDRHTKVDTVCGEVKRVVDSGEKVVVFCDHHATAAEFGSELAKMFPVIENDLSDEALWRGAWSEILGERDDDPGLADPLIQWLCTPALRAQVRGWIGSMPADAHGLAVCLDMKHPRGESENTIANEARGLLHDLARNDSATALLRRSDRKEVLSTQRVLTLSDVGTDGASTASNRQPDVAILVFNSPFGPDVLVTTDRLSEGIDLHTYCRHLVHYELDPSPIRTAQREGRIRRVNGWAARTKKPVRYAYPAFIGTRDEKLVALMHRRLDVFGLLLGGVRGIDLDHTDDADEQWRKEVINLVHDRLATANRSLVARELPPLT